MRFNTGVFWVITGLPQKVRDESVIFDPADISVNRPSAAAEIKQIELPPLTPEDPLLGITGESDPDELVPAPPGSIRIPLTRPSASPMAPSVRNRVRERRSELNSASGKTYQPFTKSYLYH